MAAAAGAVPSAAPPRTVRVLAALTAEAHPALDASPLAVGLGEVAARAGVAATPPRRALVAALAARGYTAVVAAAGDKALKSDAPMAVLVAVMAEVAAALKVEAAAAAAAAEAEAASAAEAEAASAAAASAAEAGTEGTGARSVVGGS